MSNNQIRAAEYLAMHTSLLSPEDQPQRGQTVYKANSIRLSLPIQAQAEALTELSGLSFNRVMSLIIQEGLDSYYSEIEGTDLHQAFIHLKNEILTKLEKEHAK